MKWQDGSSAAKKRKLYALIILVVALGALALRAPRLSLRPMHTDEAVHAENFHTLLEGGGYQYDPHEYHGPTLNYFTLIPACLTGVATYVQTTEVTLRIVPVVFGVLLVLLTLFLADGLGPAVIPAAVLAALSPAMVFYSRYYIQEMLLVCFTFGLLVCGYRYSRTRAVGWAVAAGLCAGLMHATKETCIIAFGAMGLALGIMVLAQHIRGRARREVPPRVKSLHLVLGLAAAMGISALFYSSFFRNPQGILDSYLAYAGYFGRGAGERTTHVHPWYYYVQTIVFARYFDGPIWTEGGIVLLALVGVVTAVKGGLKDLIDVSLVRFITLYTLLMTIVYSAVPYKTPWCLLSFLHGMILLAGVGAVTLWLWVKGHVAKAAVAALLAVVAGHLGFEMYRANFIYYADSRNPYVYAHPTVEIFSIVDRVKEYAGLHGLGQSDDNPIQVAAPGQDYWPLPWYFRAYHVGWYTDIPAQVGPLILLSDKLEQTLTRRIYEDTPVQRRRLYLALFDSPYYMWFRPGVKMLGYVRKDLWDELAEQQANAAALMEGKHGPAKPATRDAVPGQ